MLNLINAYWTILKYGITGIRPTRKRINQYKYMGYSVSETKGGKSKEGFVKVTTGFKSFYYPNYYRKTNINGIRLNKDVPFAYR